MVSAQPAPRTDGALALSVDQRSPRRLDRKTQAGWQRGPRVRPGAATGGQAGAPPAPAPAHLQPPAAGAAKRAVNRARELDYGALDKSQYSLFVQFFRQASPYIEGHRGRTFVVAIPGEVVDEKDVLQSLLEDIALMSGLGVRLVIVVGARAQINAAMKAAGKELHYDAVGHRVTDPDTMAAAITAAGRARMEVEAQLSKGPAVTMVRRHSRAASSEGGSLRYGPALQTVAANYVAAKRKGVVNGVDYQLTGVVRFVQADAIRTQLAAGNVVMLSNLGYSVAGEVLNCDIYTVAARAAIDLQADKLIVMTLPSNQPLRDLPSWLPLSEGEAMLKALAATASASSSASSSSNSSDKESGVPPAGVLASASSELEGAQQEVDFDKWYESGLPLPLLAACTVCRGGVKRAHLVDARIDGGILLELYSRDGVGTMISTDFYEGIRPAVAPQDLAPIQRLLQPLEEQGILVKRSTEQLLADLPHFTVVEREARVLGCAMVKPLGANAAGQQVGELAAFCVDPKYRGSGKGDSLLEYLESDARRRGIRRLVLLTTRTADWFQQRGFQPAGTAHASELLPEERRVRIDASRNSQLYSKLL